MSQSRIKKIRKQQMLRQAETVLPKTDLPSIRQILAENWKFLLILCLGTFLLYCNSLQGDFVSDDYASIPNNAQIGNFWVMAKHTVGFLNWFTYVVFGYGSVVPYHVLSVLIYLMAIVLAYVLVERVFGDRLLSKVSVSLFAVLPVHVEAVSWISGRIYIILAVYILSGLLLFMRLIETKKWIYGLGVVTVFLLSFLTDKPRPVSLVFLILLYLFYVGKKLFAIDYRKVFWYGFAVILVLGMLVYPAIVDRVNTVNFGYRGDGSIFYNPFFQYPTGITKYLQLMWAPFDLTLYHTLYVLPVWLNWLVVGLLVSVLIWGWLKDRRYFFAVMFFLLSLAPSMAPIKVSWLVAERYIFLPSLGFCILLGLIMTDLYKRMKIVTPVLWLGLLVFYAVTTFARNKDWRTNHSLWVATVRVSPNSHNAWNNIGDDYDKLGDYANAIKGFTQSTVYKPNYADAYHNRANIYFKTGNLNLARESYELALKYNPNLMQTYVSLTQIDLNEEKFDLALKHAGKAVDLNPNNFQTRYIKGVVLNEMGKVKEAKQELEICINLNPGFKPAIEILARL